MKKLPFDLEKALAGAKLVTRDGCKANNFRVNPDKETEQPFNWLCDINGGYYYFRDDGTGLTDAWDYDLFLLDESKDVAPAPPMPTVLPPWLTERKFYAAIALQGLLANPGLTNDGGFSEEAVAHADDLMEKLNKEKK